MKVAIIADDLTGAADSVAPFAGRGIASKVVFYRKHAPDNRFSNLNEVQTEACAWDSGTRELSESSSINICRRVRGVVRKAANLSPAIWFKKIDSVLRGHLRAELETMLDELPGRVPIICPAFPANGRTVRGGRVIVHGVAQDRTVRQAFGFNDEISEPAALITKMLLTADSSLNEILAYIKIRSNDPIFCNAETQQDLDRIAQVVLTQPDRLLPIGSGGLATAIAKRLSQTSPYTLDEAKFEEVPFTQLNPAFTKKRVLVVVGSRNSVSRSQINRLSAELGYPPTVLRNAPSGVENSISEMRKIWESGRRVVVLTTSTEDEFSFAAGFEHFAYDLQTAKRANRCDPWLTPGGRLFDALIVTGGDSADQFGRGFGCAGIKVEGELEPGIVQGTFIKGLHSNLRLPGMHGLPVIAKSGGFGDENLLCRCCGVLGVAGERASV